MSKILKKALTANWFHSLVYHLIRLYALTFRLRVENEKEWMPHLQNGGRVLLCAWHQQFFSAIRYFKTYQHYAPGLMISRSADGELIAGVAARSGWRPVRGSSSKGGRTAMVAVIHHLQETGLAGHVVDGPTGPAGKVKAGLIRIALGADAVIVPFYVSADRAWYFKSWDRFFIPKPFAKVTLTYDHMIPVHEPESEADFEAQRLHVENRMLKWLTYPDQNPQSVT